MLLALAAAGLLLLAGTVAIRTAINQYLRSDGFASRLSAAAGSALAADCRVEDLSWQDSTAYASRFTATGRDDAAFRSLELSDLRATLDTGAIGDGVWRIPQVRIARATIDFSEDGRAAAEPPGVPPTGDAPASAPGWLERWLPRRTDLGPVLVDRFDFTRGSSTAPAGLSGTGFSLEVTPELSSSRFSVEGRSGTVTFADFPHVLKVNRFRSTFRPEEMVINGIDARLGAATLTAEGEVRPGRRDSIQLTVRLEDGDLKDWLPGDWLKRFSGKGSIKAKLKGHHNDLVHCEADGSFQIREALLEALPVLEIIARKTQNAGFLRLQVKEITGEFERSAQQEWKLRRFRADAPGLLRLKGEIDIAADDALAGRLLLGIPPGTLRYLAGAEQTVFLPVGQAGLRPSEKSWLSPDDSALLWTAFDLRGTLLDPSENLSDRLASAWFHATVEEVTSLSMEAAALAARTAAGAADAVLEAAPPILETAPGLLRKGVESGTRLLDGLLPR